MADGGLAPKEGGSEDGITGGPKTPQQIAAHRRLQQTQAQVDEVVNIISENVEKVLERDVKLSVLDGRAEALQQGASQFEQQAGKLKRKFWLQNLKMLIIGGVIGLIIIALIASKFMPDSPPQHFDHTSQPKEGETIQKSPNQKTPPAVSAPETKSTQDISEQTSGKSQPPGGNKQLFAEPSYQLNLKY